MMHGKPHLQTTRRGFLKTGLAGATLLGTGNTAATLLAAQQKQPRKITRDAPQIFVDLEQVEQLDNVKQLFHTAQKHPDNPVLRGETRLETSDYSPTASIIYDEEDSVFKGWYMGHVDNQKRSDGHNVHTLNYVISEDGVCWQRPELGLHEVLGSKKNNVVVPPEYHRGKDHWESVLKDSFDEDPQRRYKAIGWSSYDPDTSVWCTSPGHCGIYTMTSPDGQNWTHTTEPVFHFRPRPETDDLGPVGDAQAIMIDPVQRRYVAFLRGSNRLFSVSRDFVHWTPPEDSLTPLANTPGGVTLYNHVGFNYGDSYLGIVSYFHTDRMHLLDTRLLTSSDGLYYTFPGPAPRDRPALISDGAIGEWDRLQTRLTGAPPVVVGDKLYLYYRGFSTSHDKSNKVKDHFRAGAIGLATLRLDGFASLAAGFDGGRATTWPIVFDEGTLRINAKANFHAEVAVEILDEGGQPIPGYRLEECVPCHEDSVDQPVRWKDRSEVTELAGRPVRLCFHLTNARLYAYRIG